MPARPQPPTPVELIKPKRAPDLVEVPARTVLSLTGEGDPNAPPFGEAVGALYGIAYTLKFGRREAGGEAFKVGPLVGEWRVEGRESASDAYRGDHPSAAHAPPPDAWRWTIQIDVPSNLDDHELAMAVEKATTRKRGKLEDSEEARRIELVRTEPVRCARILHIGPYADEPETFGRMDTFLAEQGLAREPWHIEVYLSDPSRTKPENLKTGLLAVVTA